MNISEKELIKVIQEEVESALREKEDPVSKKIKKLKGEGKPQ